MASDLAHPNDPEILVVELSSHEPLFFPLPCLHGGIGLGDPADEGKDHGQGVLGRRDSVPARGVHNYDATLSGGRDIDIVQTGAGPADDTEFFGGREHVRRHLRAAPHDQPVIVLNVAQELLFGHLRLHIDGEARFLEDFDALLRKVVADENFHF